MKRVSLLLVLLALAGATAAASGAASPTAQTGSRGFCSTARSVARSIVSSTTLPKGQVTPAALRTAYTKVAAAEPALLATAPTSLKPDLRPVFGFINNLIADFKQVNWKISNMTSQLPTLAVQARRVSPHIRVVRAYLNTTCKLDV
jgi:hypothetical protein